MPLTDSAVVAGPDARWRIRLAVGVVLLTYSSLFLPWSVVEKLAGREMIYETLGAVFFLGASIGFFVAWKRQMENRPDPEISGSSQGSALPRLRTLAYGCLGLLFLVACGEELSWGQHVLGFETPEGLRGANVQAEVNLHNLSWLDSYDADGEKKSGYRAWLNSNRLFDYFMATLFWLIPLAYRWIDCLRRPLWRLGAPIVVPSWGIPLLASVLASSGFELWWVTGSLQHLAVSEIREFNYAFLCALVAWFFAANHEAAP